MFNRVSPIIAEKEAAIVKYSNNTPVLDWSIRNQRDILHSGWNPMKGVNICFCDESAINGRMWFIVEIHKPYFNLNTLWKKINIPYICDDAQDSIIAYGYYFEKDPRTKKINMMFRNKPFRGRERVVIYHNCQYFALDFDEFLTGRTHRVIQSRFTLSNEWQDKTVVTGVNFIHPDFRDFAHIVDKINDFIQTNKIQEHIPETIQAFPLLKLIRQIPEEFIHAHDMSLYTNRDGYIGHPNPTAVATIEDPEDSITIVECVL